MSALTPIESKNPLKANSSQQNTLTPSDIQELVSFAARGLVAMFDKDKQIFCHRVVSANGGLVREGVSPRYTVMTLLGLGELKATGVDSPLDLGAIYASFVRDTHWIQGAGDLGLLIWLAAAFAPEQLENLLHTLDCETALERFSDAREGRTMELAWFLSGLAHAAEARPQLTDRLTNLAMKTYQRLEQNQGEHGYFGHMNSKNFLAGRVRGRIGSFADQVYPIYAISKFSQAFHSKDALIRAERCARAICNAQGKSGQWWWLYDARSGRISSRYPVYAVHQHGMAPMCLFALEKATGKSFRDSIYKGLHWIYGANELGVDMRDGAQKLIWRCILPGNPHRKFWEMVMNAVRPQKHDEQVRSLKVLYEQRPYEFGWLLFAFAGHASAEPLLKSIE